VRHASPPGAMLIAESPTSPSKLAPAHATEVVRTVFMVYRLTFGLTCEQHKS
jgi:hypothetical protein